MTGAAEAAGRSGTLLVVDDEEALVELLGLRLRELGWSVAGFLEAPAALEAFRASPGGFDGVVCDLAMPGLDGFAFAREVLALRPATPVVLVSGYVQPEDVQRGEELGVRAFVEKGTRIEEIVRGVDAAFADASPAPG